jgi:hypothetical protein
MVAAPILEGEEVPSLGGMRHRNTLIITMRQEDDQ